MKCSNAWLLRISCRDDIINFILFLQFLLSCNFVSIGLSSKTMGAIAPTLMIDPEVGTVVLGPEKMLSY